MLVQGFSSFANDVSGNFVFPFTLQQLVVLRTLAMSQTLEEAAAALSMSESNVRATLSKLEKDLEVELLQAQVKRCSHSCSDLLVLHPACCIAS